MRVKYVSSMQCINENHLVWREFGVRVIGSSESSCLQGREGRVEQRRVKCCRAEEFSRWVALKAGGGSPCQLGEKKCSGLSEMAQVTR